jgi:hypothetical protein
MNLYQRTCRDCDCKFDLSKDKYWVKPRSKFNLVINALVNIIIFTSQINIGESKLICESCHRNLKLKKLLK